jgi:hypothetical protein
LISNFFNLHGEEISSPKASEYAALICCSWAKHSASGVFSCDSRVRRTSSMRSKENASPVARLAWRVTDEAYCLISSSCEFSHVISSGTGGPACATWLIEAGATTHSRAKLERDCRCDRSKDSPSPASNGPPLVIKVFNSSSSTSPGFAGKRPSSWRRLLQKVSSVPMSQIQKHSS